MVDPLIDAVENLSHFHREHEKFYAQLPREQAVQVQRHSRALCALADRWTTVTVEAPDALNPYEGSVDLNSSDATQLDGVLFTEVDGEPVEVTRLKRDLRMLGDDSVATGTWLGAAMEATWGASTALIAYPQLAELLGDRHRIIANDWHAASMSALAGRCLHRSVDLLDRIDFTRDALRHDLVGERFTPQYLYSAVELLDHAADLLSDSAGLVHDNEPRWRRFHGRVRSITSSRGDVP